MWCEHVSGVGSLFCTNNYLNFPSFTPPYSIPFMLLIIYFLWLIVYVWFCLTIWMHAFMVIWLPVWFANIINQLKRFGWTQQKRKWISYRHGYKASTQKLVRRPLHHELSWSHNTYLEGCAYLSFFPIFNSTTEVLL